MILTDKDTRKRILKVIAGLARDHKQSKYSDDSIRTGYEIALHDIKRAFKAELHVDA